MPKGFSVPSFSMPNMSSVKNYAAPKLDSLKAGAKAIAQPKIDSVKQSINDFKIPDIPGIESSTFQDMASIMKDAGMPTTLNDLKQELVAKKDNFKMPTVSDLKDMAKAKVGDVVETAKRVKSDGIKGLIPQDVMDMKDQMEDLGMSPTDMLKEYGGEAIGNLFKKE